MRNWGRCSCPGARPHTAPRPPVRGGGREGPQDPRGPAGGGSAPAGSGPAPRLGDGVWERCLRKPAGFTGLHAKSPSQKGPVRGDRMPVAQPHLFGQQSLAD